MNGVGGGATAGVTSLTTAGFQSGVLPGNLDSTTWATGLGLYPYLKWQYPNATPQAISGFAQNNDAAGKVTTVINGAVVGTSSIGANGYYYSLIAPGALANANVFTYAQSGGNLANTFTQDVTGTTSHINLTANTLLLSGNGGSLSSLLTDLGNASVNSYGKLFTLDASGLNTGSNVQLTQSGSFIVDQILNAGGSSTVRGAGDLTLAPGAKVSGSDVILSATGAFINSAGSGAVTATSGHWVIYSDNPDADTFGMLNSNNTAIWNADIDNLAASDVNGDRYVFRYQPTITYTSIDVSKTYGDTADLSAAYIVSGLSTGVTDAFAADILGDAVSGVVEIFSTGTAATTGVGSYAIQESQGTLSGLAGYLTAIVSTGNLTVNAKHIDVTATGGTSTYGDTTSNNPGFTATGLVNGQTISSLSGLSNNFAVTNATNAGSTVLQVIGTLSNGNYVVDQRIDGSWTVTAKNITVAANSGHSTYGDTNVRTGLDVNGLVNGQSASVLSGLSTTGISGTTNTGTHVLRVLGALTNGNYTVTQTSTGQWTVEPRALVVTADSLGKIVNASDPVLTWTTNGNLVNGDHLNGNLMRSAGEAVGQYAVGQGTLNNSNYAITYNPGAFNIDVTETTRLQNEPQNVAAAATRPSRELPNRAAPVAALTVSSNLYNTIDQGLRLPEGL
jgi:hypothetical protein